MKKRGIIVTVLVALFLFTNTAFATNWIYVRRVDESAMNFYFDTETAYKNSETITFWTLGVWDKTRSDGVKKAMARYEATLSTPRYYRQIDGYLYDDGNNELNHDAQAREWQKVPANDSAVVKSIGLAFSYAK